MRGFLYWTPRVLAILYTLFITLFALDAFSQGYRLQDAILAFIIHLLPTFVLLGTTTTAWYKERLGGILFLALAIAYILIAWDRFPFLTHLVMTGPLFITGLLFVMSNKPPEKKIVIKPENERVI